MKAPAKAWLPYEIELLRTAYTDARLNRDIQLDALSARLGRHKTNVSRKARQLGLTDNRRKTVEARKDRRKFSTVEDLRAHQSAQRKAWLAENEHPRGMTGKKHTQEVKDRITETSRARRAAMSIAAASAITVKMMKTKIERYGTIAPIQESRGTWKAGWREIGGYRKYYRSRWEANYARYLQWLKERGEILDWKHEPETFWFEAIKRGVRSYLPDFRVWEKGGSSSLHEVKGWMDDRSKTTLKRMAKYHPNEKIIVVRERDYNAIAKTVGPMITGWEKSERKDRW